MRKNRVCLAARPCARRSRHASPGWCSALTLAAGLQKSDQCREHDGQETENCVCIQAGFLFSASDHLIHAISSQDLPELIGRTGVLPDVLQKGLNALCAAHRLLLLKHGFKDAADYAGELTGICRGSATAVEGGRQAFEIALLGGTGRIVQGGENSVKEAHSFRFVELICSRSALAPKTTSIVVAIARMEQHMRSKYSSQPNCEDLDLSQREGVHGT